MGQFDLKEREFLVVNVNNKLYCLDSRCTHAGAPLVEGTLNGELITCPWHYSCFRVTDGSVVNGPAQQPLNIYKTVVKGDDLLIEAKFL